MSDLVERLRHDAHQLTKMVEHAKLAGPETDVRVKDPSLLLADLSESADEIQRLQREKLAWLEASLEQQKRAKKAEDALAEARRQAFVEAAALCDQHAVDAEKQAANSSSGVAHDAMLMASDFCELLAGEIRTKAEETHE